MGNRPLFEKRFARYTRFEKRLTVLKQLQTVLFEVITMPVALKKDLGTLKEKILKAEEDFLRLHTLISI